MTDSSRNGIVFGEQYLTTEDTEEENELTIRILTLGLTRQSRMHQDDFMSSLCPLRPLWFKFFKGIWQ